MAEEGAKPGMAIHGNEYHAPDFEQEGAAAALIEAHRTAATHTQDQPPAEHGNAKHNPDFEQEGVAAGLVNTHEAKTTGIHGVGASTVESASGSQGKVDTHEAKTTGVHGVGAGTVAKVGDIATDANLSAAGQDAISKRHTQNTDKIIKDADADTKVEVEQSADEDKVRMTVKGVEGFVLDDAAILTLAKQPAARAYLASNQNVIDSTYVQITLANENFDIQGEFNTGTYRYVASKAGLYLVSALVCYYNAAYTAGFFTIIKKNGVDYLLVPGRQSQNSANTTVGVIATDILQLAVNDYIELYAWQNGGATCQAIGGTGRTFLAICKLA
jgi:hypothetical protein